MGVDRCYAPAGGHPRDSHASLSSSERGRLDAFVVASTCLARWRQVLSLLSLLSAPLAPAPVSLLSAQAPESTAPTLLSLQSTKRVTRIRPRLRGLIMSRNESCVHTRSISVHRRSVSSLGRAARIVPTSRSRASVTVSDWGEGEGEGEGEGDGEG
jgi:hypothetical protein